MTALKKINKMDVALVQLETAIDLFLYKCNYICATTLAGAAEEILGTIVRRSGKPNALGELCKVIKSKYNFDAKDIVESANYPRNEFKHFKFPEREDFEDDLQAVAAGYIVRAITNLFMHDKTMTCNTEAFLKWIYDNRPDLNPKE
jgi:hypothetical protein